MSLTNAEIVEVRDLVAKIVRWRIAYYNSKPEVSDQVYDGAEMRLKSLIPDHPIFDQVGAPTGDGFETIDYVAQGVPKMLSLDKVYTADEVVKFVSSYAYVPMVKLDGMSIRAVYSNNKLKVAHTRGNGSVGDIVTSNFYFVSGAIPKTWPKVTDFEVRGEVCMLKADFEALNRERFARQEEVFSNPRNAAVGSLKNKDFTETAARKLTFFAYVLVVPGMRLSKMQQLEALEKMGFQTPRIKNADALKGLKECIDFTTSVREKLPVDIDGIVFALDDVDIREGLGCTAHHPRYEMAYKFASDSGETTLKAIEWEVSRTRRVVPVGIIEPIELSGATCTRVTLNNAKWVYDKRICAGEKITVKRAGDVIPNFVGTIRATQDIPMASVVIPRVCPSCSAVLTRHGVDIVCPNTKCSGAAIKVIKHYVSKPVVNIDGVGEVLVDQLVESGLIKTAADLFTLTKSQLMTLDRMGDRKADKILEAINAVKKQTPRVFLLSLGIECLGKDVSEKIQDLVDFDTMQLTSDIINIDGIGETTANAVMYGLEQMKWLAEELKKHITIEKAQTVQLGTTLNGKSFCVSGHVELNFADGAYYEDRDAIQQLIKNYGGRAVSSVSKKLDYLVAGPGSGSKSDKANEYGLPIISGADLVKMMEGK